MTDEISCLIAFAKERFRELGLSENTIRNYDERSFNQIVRKYDESNVALYQQAIMDDFIDEIESQLRSNAITRETRCWRVRGAKILEEIHDTGTFEWKIYHEKQNPIVPCQFKEVVESYETTLPKGSRDSVWTIHLVCRMCVFLENRSVKQFGEIGVDDIRFFLADAHDSCPHSMDKVVAALRNFFKYLKSLNLIENDFSLFLACPRSRDHRIKPAMTNDELIEVLNQVDRKTKMGKRDYAILVLAICTGLRAGDIAKIKLSDIHWESDQISLTQSKTGHRLTLPLREICRDALADYVLNSRPKCDFPEVFLKCSAPAFPLASGATVSSIFRRYLNRAGIVHIPNDGKTFHGIRRFLGTNMVSEGVPITTVSQVLGHQSTRPTRQYVSIDMEGLKKCPLSMKGLGGKQ